jgi:hypothetical protein
LAATAPVRGDHGHLPVDQIGRQLRQAVELPGKVMLLDRHVLAVRIAGFGEALAEGGHVGDRTFRRAAIDEADHRQRRFLRARHSRPSNCRETERGYELPPSDVDCHLPRTHWVYAGCDLGARISHPNTGFVPCFKVFRW